MLNPDLNAMLDHSVKVIRPTETVTKGVTVLTLSSTVIGTKACHIQPVGPVEVQKVWGAEERGTHQAFMNSTVGVQRGDLMKQVTGPYPSGHKWWVTALRRYTTVGGQHTRVLLDVTTESTS